MKRFYGLALASALALSVFTGQNAEAYQVIDFGPNGAGGNCYCYSLQDGYTPQSATTPSFLALHMCPSSTGGWNSYTQPETMTGIGNFPAGNVIISLPPPPAGMRRVLVCGNPPGTTPLANYGTATVYASYVDVPCPNGVSGQQVPTAQQPPWMTQFQGGNGYYPVCNP